MSADTQRLRRYRQQSLRLLDSALDQMRGGGWSQCEELLWASLTLAVKGVALSRAEILEGDQGVRDYAVRLGREQRDRRIREAFDQLVTFADVADRLRESRSRADHLFLVLEDVRGAVHQLWEMVPREEEDER